MRSLDHPFYGIAASRRFRRDLRKPEGLHEAFNCLIGRHVFWLTCRPVDDRSSKSPFTIPGIEAIYRLLHQLAAEELIQRVQSFRDCILRTSVLKCAEVLLNTIQPLAKSFTLIVYRPLFRGKLRYSDLLQDVSGNRVVIELHRLKKRLEVAALSVR